MIISILETYYSYFLRTGELGWKIRENPEGSLSKFLELFRKF